MGRGGIQLNTAMRAATDISDLYDTALFFGVNTRRQVYVIPGMGDSPLSLAPLPVDEDDLRGLFDAGKMWYIGDVDDQPYIGMNLTDEHLMSITGANRVDITAEGPLHGARWSRIRYAGADLCAGQSSAVSHALALAVWHANTTYCTRCGRPYRVAALGWERHCHHCDVIEYPRQDPAIIVAVIDDNDRLLLAHNVLWRNPLSRSILAGYVEAGESPENAVHREVAEETGLTIDHVTYVGSQAWPFPRSLMIGYMAHARQTDLQLEPAELDEGHFYTRQQFLDAVTDGVIHPPGPSTIASALIIRWLKQPIPYPGDKPVW